MLDFPSFAHFWVFVKSIRKNTNPKGAATTGIAVFLLHTSTAPRMPTAGLRLKSGFAGKFDRSRGGLTFVTICLHGSWDTLTTGVEYQRNKDMSHDAEITAMFWKHLRSDRLVMMGREPSAAAAFRPMTAQLEEDTDHGPIWFFTSTDTALMPSADTKDAAIFTFVSKGYDVFATVHGHLTQAADRATIDRLWNKWVAAWYEGGKDDPKLVLLRFDPASAEIWRNGTSFFSGLKLLMGGDPKVDAKDNVAKVALS